MPDAPVQVTAAQIAKVLGKTRQAVRKALLDVPATGVVIVSGNEAQAWRVESLPMALREQLADRASAGGYRDAAHLLAAPAERWQPPLPLAGLAPAALDRANKLREALRLPLARRNDPALARGELETLGLRDYRAVFKHEITATHWRRLLDRTLARDRGFEDFDRLEIYLDEVPARNDAAAPETAPATLPALARALATLAHPAAPTATDESRALWLAAIEDFEALLTIGRTGRAAKEIILDELTARAPFLARNRDAMRQAFNWKRAKWLAANANPKALRDGREEANRERGLDIPAEDVDVIVAHAVMTTGGRVSQAWRECLTQNLLSESFRSRYQETAARKSHVPAAVREAVRHEVAMLYDVHRKPRHTRDNGAYIDRYWGAVPSGAWYCADDCTLPVYYIVPDGQGWWTLLRGQFLLMIDARSLCVLGFAMIPEKGYNARVIRTLITNVADEYGLPTRGFYFERGTWENSKILKGVADEAAVPSGELELGLREFGLEFKHAIRARSKPVERVLGALQNHTEREPGYAGRDERHDPHEHLQKLKRDVESRRIDPLGRFYTLERWSNRLEEICGRFNAEPVEGKHTGGLSPEDAFHLCRDQHNPRIRFGPELRYLLAHHKRPVRVGPNGITMLFGRQKFVYRNERTGQLRGQGVLAWFNPDCPEILTVTDFKRRNAFLVERSREVPALDAPEELLAEEMRKVEAHMGYARTRYRVLKSKHAQDFRPTLADRQTVELGRVITGETNRIRERQREGDRKLQIIRDRAGRSGIPVEIMDTSRAEAGAGASLFLEGLRELEQE